MAYTSKNSKSAPANSNKPPVAKLKDGLIFLNIWERATDKGSFYSATIERRYKKKDGEWASTHSLGQDDLLGAAELLKQAYTEIKHLRSPLREQN